MADSEVLKQLRQRVDTLNQARLTWLDYWRDVKDYICPQQGRLDNTEDEQNNGKKKTSKIINGAATNALEILASGMQSGLTSKALPWFRLSSPDPDLNKWPPVARWFRSVQDRLYYMFDRSNIYNALYHTYYELGGFGTAAMAVLEHPTRILRARPFTIGEYWMDLNEFLETDVFVRREWMTARQMMAYFGKDRVTQAVQNAFEKSDLKTRFEVINIIEKNDDVFDLKECDGKPFRSIYFEAKGRNDNDNRGLLSVKGYYEFPVMCPRWHVTGSDVYGWGPCRKVIDNTKMLQSMESDKLKALAKLVKPPMNAPPELKGEGVDVSPGAINYSSSGSGQSDALRPLYQVQPDVQGIAVAINSVVNEIKTGLYNQLFMMIAQTDKTMTATEVAERHQEKLLMLGPVLERVHSELLDVLINRSYAMAFRAGAIPPMPMDLRGKPVRIDYVSILSQAQKAVDVTAIEQATHFLGTLAAVKPEVLNVIDLESAGAMYAQLVGVHPDLLRTPEEIAKLEAQAQQQLRQQQQAQLAAQYADSARVVSQVDPQNLRQVAQQLTGGGGMMQ